MFFHIAAEVACTIVRLYSYSYVCRLINITNIGSACDFSGKSMVNTPTYFFFAIVDHLRAFLAR